ncbi:MAG: hypothetical protein CVU13_10560 [Bacteroidetes bacterium HGW-Bacteroidetes-8]|jgi:hypothetical protein|nr:MAG: hypothetical protein CVU13_10560 [Bacteroidetes bacterium HGW-Bacteroidetes-8]
MKKRSKIFIAVTSVLVASFITLFQFSTFANEVIPTTDLDDDQHIFCRGQLEYECVIEGTHCLFEIRIAGLPTIFCDFEGFHSLN